MPSPTFTPAERQLYIVVPYSPHDKALRQARRELIEALQRWSSPWVLARAIALLVFVLLVGLIVTFVPVYPSVGARVAPLGFLLIPLVHGCEAIIRWRRHRRELRALGSDAGSDGIPQ